MSLSIFAVWERVTVRLGRGGMVIVRGRAGGGHVGTLGLLGVLEVSLLEGMGGEGGVTLSGGGIVLGSSVEVCIWTVF